MTICNLAGPNGKTGCQGCCYKHPSSNCLENCMNTPYGQNGGYMGTKMKEKIIKIEKAKTKGKKYTATVQNRKTKKNWKINFGATGYEQFKDRTPLKLYKKFNHSNKKRQERYYSRFSRGIKNRKKAIQFEENKSKGLYNSKILSHIYLW